MPINCTSEDLVDASKCFTGVPPNMQLPVLIKIFCEIASMSCTADSLVESAKCIASIPPHMQMPVLIYLACAILTNGGVPSSGTCITCGDDPPTEDATCDCSIYYTKGVDAGVWLWNATSGAWDVLIQPGV